MLYTFAFRRSSWFRSRSLYPFISSFSIIIPFSDSGSHASSSLCGAHFSRKISVASQFDLACLSRPRVFCSLDFRIWENPIRCRYEDALLRSSSERRSRNSQCDATTASTRSRISVPPCLFSTPGCWSPSQCIIILARVSSARHERFEAICCGTKATLDALKRNGTGWRLRSSRLQRHRSQPRSR